MNQNAFDEYVISLRRKFHQHPELSGKEKDTRAVICAELEKLGIPYDIVDAKNVIGCIKNGSGKRIAFRADIDALPVEEQVDVPWKSNTPALCTPADMMRTPQLCWVPQSYLQKTPLSGMERFTCASNVVKRPA